jgi:cobalt-zinc-cadmium efflux system outer membrane protein
MKRSSFQCGALFLTIRENGVVLNSRGKRLSPASRAIKVMAFFFTKKPVLEFLFLAFIVLFAANCVRFHPRPISSAQTMDDFEARRLDAPEVKEYLQSKPGIGEWPPSSWDLRGLTLVAMFYHPDLDVARAQWGVAQAGRITAGERPNPTGSILMGYNSTTPVQQVTPWIPEAVLEIPVETAGKRGYRIAQARHLSEAARLNILSVAWEVRSRLRLAFLDLFAARETESLLNTQHTLQSESLRILEAQWAVGEASLYNVTQARIVLDSTRLALLEAAKQSSQALVRLAGAVGLPVKSLASVTFSFEEFLNVQADIPQDEVRRRALLNRADILGALSEYEASQSALQLEIAKQYPDINIGPGYQLDQTDSKWTMALSLVLPVFSRNKGPIAEAKARRTETAARFLALQAKVIGDIESAVAACRSAVDKAKTADDLQTSLKEQEAAAKARYELGEISKFELLSVQLELASSALARLEALVKAQQAVGELEDAMQSPLDLKDWLLEPQTKALGQAKERKDE